MRNPEIRSHYDHYYITPLNIRFYFLFSIEAMQHISAFLTLVSIFHTTLNVFHQFVGFLGWLHKLY